MQNKLARIATIMTILATLGGMVTWVSSVIVTKSDFAEIKKQIAINYIELSIIQAEDSLFMLELAEERGTLSPQQERRYQQLVARIARLSEEKERRINE